MPMAGLSQQVSSNHPDYKSGIEYDQDNGLVAMTFPAVLYKIYFVEVDAGKELDLKTSEYLGGLNPEQNKKDSKFEIISGVANSMFATKAAVNPQSNSEENGNGANAQSGHKIAPLILENGIISQKIKLDLRSNGFVLNTNGLDFGKGTLVISCPNLKKTTDEETTNKAKLYIFLSPQVLKTSAEATDYLSELATDITCSDPTIDDVEPSAPNSPEDKIGIEYDSSEVVGDFNKFVAVFSERTGNKYVVDEKIIQKLNGQKFAIRLAQQTSADACNNIFKKFLDDLGCVAVPFGAVIKIMEK
jgi:hypothetical protein